MAHSASTVFNQKALSLSERGLGVILEDPEGKLETFLDFFFVVFLHFVSFEVSRYPNALKKTSQGNLYPMALELFIAFSADDFPLQSGVKGILEDPDELRKLHQKLESADRQWRGWAEATGGSILSIGRGYGVMKIRAENLADLPTLREGYSNSLQSKVSLGVGSKMSFAEQARKVAMIRGGDRIVLHQPGMEKEIEDAQKNKDPLEDVAEQLGKSVSPGMNQGAGAGYQGFRQPKVEAPAAPVEVQNEEHSEAEAARSLINDPERPAPLASAPELSPEEDDDGDSDLADKFHALADAQAQKDEQSQQSSNKELDQAKKSLAQVLEQVRAHAPALAQAKKTNPETYNVVMGLVQNVIQLARSIQPIQKSEDLSKAVFQGHETFPVQGTPAADSSRQAVTPKPPDYKSALALAQMASQKANETDSEEDNWHAAWAHRQAFELSPGPQHDPVDSRGYGSVPEPAEFHADQATLHERRAEMAQKRSGGESKKPEWLDKASMSLTQHHDLGLPVGTVKDGAGHRGTTGMIKVKHGSGKTGWVSVRAGMISSLADRHGEPTIGTNAHPISSRNPTGH